MKAAKSMAKREHRRPMILRYADASRCVWLTGAEIEALRGLGAGITYQTLDTDASLAQAVLRWTGKDKDEDHG